MADIVHRVDIIGAMTSTKRSVGNSYSSHPQPDHALRLCRFHRPPTTTTKSHQSLSYYQCPDQHPPSHPGGRAGLDQLLLEAADAGAGLVNLFVQGLVSAAPYSSDPPRSWRSSPHSSR